MGNVVFYTSYLTALYSALRLLFAGFNAVLLRYDTSNQPHNYNQDIVKQGAIWIKIPRLFSTHRTVQNMYSAIPIHIFCFVPRWLSLDPAYAATFFANDLQPIQICFKPDLKPCISHNLDRRNCVTMMAEETTMTIRNQFVAGIRSFAFR